MENLINQTIAGCRIEQLLGQGGMGSVYKAWNINLDIPVVIKFLDSRFNKNPQLVEQFFLEARTTARLDSPYIVRIMQVGEENGHYFIQMEFVEGESLQKKIERESPLPLPLALNFLHQIALGLKVAHLHGVIHRDIKPDNILIHKKGILKIVDFGLVKLLEHNMPDFTPEKLLGSPHYLSPEQCEGKTMDARSDIYSLGVIFYFMITGKLPFQENTPLAIAASRLYSPPISPLSIIPSLPQGLEIIIKKMMARSLDERYQSIDFLLEDIIPFMAENPLVCLKQEKEDSPSLSFNKLMLPENSHLQEKQSSLPSMEVLEHKLKSSLPIHPVAMEKKKRAFFYSYILVIFIILFFCIIFYLFHIHAPAKNYQEKNLVFFDQRGPIAKEISGTWKIYGKKLQGTAKGFRESQITWELPNKPFRLSMEFLLQQIHSMPRPGSKLEILIRLEEKQYRISFYPKTFVQNFTIEGNSKEIFFFGMEIPLPEKTKILKGNALITLSLKSAKIEINHIKWSKK